MQTNKWVLAQKKEAVSWLNTDMQYEYLINNWHSRINNFKFITEKINQNSQILDVGSGPVSVLHIFPRCKMMVALDPLNNEYKKRYKRLNYIQYPSLKAEKINFSDSSFDFITCVNALDHVENYCDVLNEMARCLRSNGRIYLEYENTSPLSVFLSKLGYKKPLSDFHPILVENKKILKLLQEAKFQIISIKIRPQLSFEKIKSIFNIVFARKKITTYEKNISAINYGFFKMIMHYFIIFIERLMFHLSPIRFGYFTIICASKLNEK